MVRRFLLFLLLLCCASALNAKAACDPIQIAGLTVTFNEKDGAFEFKDASDKKTILDMPDTVGDECLRFAQVAQSSGEKNSGQNKDASPFIEVEFWTAAEGTSVIIQEKQYALIDVRLKTFAVEPLVLVRKGNSARGASTDQVATVEWSKKPRLKLVETDLETKKKSVLWPH